MPLCSEHYTKHRKEESLYLSLLYSPGGGRHVYMPLLSVGTFWEHSPWEEEAKHTFFGLGCLPKTRAFGFLGHAPFGALPREGEESSKAEWGLKQAGRNIQETLHGLGRTGDHGMRKTGWLCLLLTMAPCSDIFCLALHCMHLPPAEEAAYSSPVSGRLENSLPHT